VSGLKVISLSWGRQSFTLAAMCALGELPMVDVAIFADTGHERKETYAFAGRWAPWLEDRGVRVVTVQNPQPIDEMLSGRTDLPAFTHNGKTRGQLRRQCTGDWKIMPMRRWISAELKRLGLKKTPGIAELWIGITLDEYQRMKDADVKYIRNRWPLVDLRLTREDCETWLQATGLPVPVKSSCVFCPYHDNVTWLEIQRDDPDSWAKALQMDSKIRKARPPYDLYLHQARKPLEDIDLSQHRTRPKKSEARSQWENECSGMCGV
jgi:hypothetical protein